MRLSIRLQRRVFQSGVVLAFAAIPLLNQYLTDFSLVSGNFLSFHFAGLTLADPMAILQAILGSMSANGTMLLAAGLVLLLALLLGPVFCGWICPYGLLSELAHPAEPGPAGKGGAEKNTLRPFAIKSGIVLLGLLLVLTVMPFPVLNQLSMPGWFSRALQYAVMYKAPLWGLGLLVAVLAAERILRKRFWCRYVCPQSWLINLAGMVLPARLGVRFDRKKCTCPAADRVCNKACSLGLDPRSQGAGLRMQCSNCGDCVDACRGKGKALGFGFSPVKKGD